MAKVILNTFGSFGDLHPYLAIAIELKNRGHYPLIATSEVYRAKIEAEGISFAPVRPNVGELLGKTQSLKKLWDPKHGSKYLLRDYLLPQVQAGYEDLSAICQGADLLLTHAASYAGPIVAEKQNLRWLSIALQPAIFFSRYDPPVVAPALWARHFYGLGIFAPMLMAARFQTSRWAEPVFELRKSLGLPRGGNPVIEGQFSPHGTLALFSPHFAAPQPDWPVNTKVTGFVTYDKRGEGFGPSSSSIDLDRFLDTGPPPLVFTLGSSAVMSPGEFFTESIKAAKQLSMRAVLLVGKTDSVRGGDSVYVTDYAPYSELFPRAAAIIHQGGIGTTAQALKSGRPMIIVPWAHDQPDNAERCRKLGVSRTILRTQYTENRIVRELRKLLQNPPSISRQIGVKLGAEGGLKCACDALEG